MAGIRAHGSVRPFLDGMMSLDERSDLLGLSAYEALDDELSGRAPAEETA